MVGKVSKNLAVVGKVSNNWWAEYRTMARKKKRPALLPQRHNEPDLFVCDILDATPKGDRASMEHPLFSLSPKKDMATFVYERGNVKLTITPSQAEGRANIMDRDILIYVLSQLMAAKNEGQKLSRRIRICAHDLLKATNRYTTGQAYATLRRAITRLQFTQIETNIHDHGIGEWRSISFITDAKIVKEDATGRMLDVELEIGDWLMRAVENDNVLTLSKDYFLLRGSLERRLYELARKHCGQQAAWKIGLEALQEKCGSMSTPKEFKRMIKTICRKDRNERHIPDYSFDVQADILIVTPKPEFIEAYNPPKPLSLLGKRPLLAGTTIDKAREISKGWCPYAIEDDWNAWMADNGMTAPDKPDAAYLGFVKKWVERRGSAR